MIMYHVHNTFQFEIPCSQLLVELYQPIQCKHKNSKPFNSISVKSRLLCKMLYNVFTISTYQN
ncbi:hypothetical protein DDL24_16090 [Staphylococcus aureus]|nr:hypothetical protein DDL24_16090 [Staphylococcus aureus]